MVFKRHEEQVKWGMGSSSIIFTSVGNGKDIENYREKYKKTQKIHCPSLDKTVCQGIEI